MKVTQVALRPTEASDQSGRPALTPELLAATGARYSRSNEGLETILGQIDPAHPDKSVDRIFRFVDYGHASIADMAPVALFIDGVTLWLAYYLWTLCPVAGGQESSTRYIKLDASGLADADTLGISDATPATRSVALTQSVADGDPNDEYAPERAQWEVRMESALNSYETALKWWERNAQDDPDVLRLPASLVNDQSCAGARGDKAQKAVARMRRNYAFDRARYFLPVAVRTNVMMVQSARAWVSVCQHLLSHPLKEAQTLGAFVRDELGLAVPRLLKHAVRQESIVKALKQEFQARQQEAQRLDWSTLGEAPADAWLEVFRPVGANGTTFAADLAHHDNRYAPVGESLRRTAVRFGWDAVTFAEIRDLNRHRTGTKHCPLVPQGFYHAVDQMPTHLQKHREQNGPMLILEHPGVDTTRVALRMLQEGDPTYIYHTLLGTQYPFEHTTTADKFLYEAELRTGTGAHYRYAQQLHDSLALWYARYPETKGLVLEGSAEPE